MRLALSVRQQPAATPTDEPPPDELFRKLPDAAVVLDRTTRRVTAWNPAAEALLGYPADKAVGLPLERLIPERVQAEFRALIGPADTASGEPLLDAHGPHELPLVRRTGQEIWGELTASALGRGSIVLVVRDRTAQRASQEALSFRARLLEAVEQAVVGTDPFGRILYWNRGAERLYGWSGRGWKPSCSQPKRRSRSSANDSRCTCPTSGSWPPTLDCLAVYARSQTSCWTLCVR